MKKTLVITTILISLTSCLKKMDEVDNLNDNIFDYEYQGNAWFEIQDVITYYNQFGQLFVRVKAIIPAENTPDLKPNLIYIACDVNDNGQVIFNAYKNVNGAYPFYYDLLPQSQNNYCLKAGIYLQEQDSIINTFELCGSL